MTENRYARSKVYKLVNNIDDKVYIGSTIQNLCDRFYKHKENAVKLSNIKAYKHLNEIGWQNVRIVLILELSLKNREELRREEEKYIDIYTKQGNCLNTLRAFRSDDDEKAYKALYNREHANEIRQYQQDYYQENKERLKQRTKDNYDKVKAATYNKKYRMENEQKLREEMVCPCGGVFMRKNRYKHIKSARHISFQGPL